MRQVEPKAIDRLIRGVLLPAYLELTRPPPVQALPAAAKKVETGKDKDRPREHVADSLV